MLKTAHVAIYGNQSILRVYCHQCQTYALVVEGSKACCLAAYESSDDEPPVRARRMTQSEERRRSLSRAAKKGILEQQKGLCFYCDREIGSTVYTSHKAVTLRLHWDHMVPFSHQRNNSRANYAAACHKCNHWKSNLIFDSIEGIRAHVKTKWERFLAGDEGVRKFGL